MVKDNMCGLNDILHFFRVRLKFFFRDVKMKNENDKTQDTSKIFD